MKNVVLIGFMGSGKSTIGNLLSQMCDLPLWDTDQMIEMEVGCTIRKIFDIQGEETFRCMETALLQKLCREETLGVFSTGGGMPLRLENAQWLKKLGTVIWLRLSPDTAYGRLKQDTTRPILQCEDPKGRITQLISKRAAAYESAADITVDVDDKSKEQIVREILEALEENEI